MSAELEGAGGGDGEIKVAARSLVPQCIQWSVEQVADWVEGLGFPQYRVSPI